MSKILVIKGADFSANAVRQGLFQPTEYYEIAGKGTSSSFQNGDYYVNPNFPDIVTQKNAGGNIQISDECFVKFKNKSYFMHLNPEQATSKFDPWYGLLEIEPLSKESGKYASVTNDAISFVTNASYGVYRYTLAAGKTCTWLASGVRSKGTLIAVNSEGTASVISSTADMGDLLYTNNTDNEVTLYLNILGTWGNNWVAEIVV